MASAPALAQPVLTQALVRARLFSLARLGRELAALAYVELLGDVEAAELDITDDLAADLEAAGDLLGM
jgi:hypothetical protein